jgi:hypothetical protein
VAVERTLEQTQPPAQQPVVISMPEPVRPVNGFRQRVARGRQIAPAQLTLF